MSFVHQYQRAWVLGVNGLEKSRHSPETYQTLACPREGKATRADFRAKGAAHHRRYNGDALPDIIVLSPKVGASVGAHGQSPADCCIGARPAGARPPRAGGRRRTGAPS